MDINGLSTIVTGGGSGLGEASAVERVRVIWPGGRTEEWTGVEVDGWTTLAEGTGTAGGAR